MNDFAALLNQGQPWLFVPTAVALGALHGLEPGHSKTMMAAFIVAVRGTVRQAVLLGLAATLSHTAVVWAIALAGLWFGRQWQGEAFEGWFQLASGLMILGIAAWMAWRVLNHRSACGHDHGAEGGHHGHAHAPGQPHGHDHHDRDAHRREAGHACTHDHGHGHGQAHGDAHGHAHAHDEPSAQAEALTLRHRYPLHHASTRQIVVFGLTGGLLPCPASISVLLVCLQLKKLALGVALVLCFSVGLAATLVAAGVVAALGARHASRRMGRFDFNAWLEKAPLISAALIGAVGVYVTLQAWRALAGA
ncbi:MAG: nickel/cobalt efflux transporter RcnA [Pelomonas sp.]|nr:nickel/cobalt efflux transporter RcnA [Roseateles sp.]